MDLKKLFENSVLNDETKQVVQEAFSTAIQAKEIEMNQANEVALVEAKAEMIGSISELVEEAVAEEMQAIAEEIQHARTLEVQYADKLQTFKESYAERQSEEVQSLIAEAVAEEIGELKEDIEMAKKHEFVMQMFESFKTTYEKLFGSTEVSVYDELEESKKQLDALVREKKLAGLLEGLQGKKKAIAETILESVSTEKLEAKFESIQAVLLSESKKDADDEALTESVKGEVVMENVEEVEEKQVQESVKDPLVTRLENSLKWVKR